MKPTLLAVVFFVVAFGPPVYATSNHDYGADEYDTVIGGLSPDGKYAITTHGGGDYGYDHFHVFLTNAITGRRIGPLEEIGDNLDTGADAFSGRWSDDSSQVTIVWRISRHEPLKAVTYRIGKGRAFVMKGPADATDEEARHWQDDCSTQHTSPKIFGTIVPQPWQK